MNIVSTNRSNSSAHLVTFRCVQSVRRSGALIGQIGRSGVDPISLQHRPGGVEQFADLAEHCGRHIVWPACEVCLLRSHGGDDP